MTNGLYRTARGSTVRVSGAHSGIFDIAFDWVEEEHACIDCVPSMYGDELTWSCDYHETCGGSVKLERVDG